ncbi:MAG: tetratricopeptide repeat protein [Rhodocyclaceae bacterium]
MTDHERGRVLFQQALQARAQGDHASAETLLREALTHAPGRESLRLNLSGALIDQGKFDEGLVLCRELVQDFPANPLGWQRLSLCEAALGQTAAALASIDRSLTLAPDDVGALGHRLQLLMIRTHDNDAALQTAQRALALSADNAALHTGLGIVQTARRAFTAARDAHRQALALTPHDADCQWNLALAELMLGEFADGWRHYEARWSNAQPAEMLYGDRRPRWDGTSALQGKRLVVWAEQGLGDTLQCSRYLAQLAAQDVALIFQVPRQLIGLLRSLPGYQSIVQEGDVLPPHDLQLPLMSLPAFLPGPIPAPARLAPSSTHRQRWAGRLGPRQRPRVGLMWQGNISNQPGLHRSLQVSQLAPLLSLPLEFHCVGNAVSAEDRRWLQQHAPALQIHADQLKDFSDTAALLEQLDLLITIDTSIAHLGPSLDVPSWVLLSWQADWRWAPEGDSTPWYPQSRLFRQPQTRRWDEVVRTLADALAAHFQTD